MSEVSKIIMNGVEYPIKDASAREQIDVERKRISNLASLSDGSTTGDAELIDIRVGVDGTIYDSAGDAVRGQVDALQDDVDNKVNELKDDLGDLKTFKNIATDIMYKKGYTVNAKLTPASLNDYNCCRLDVSNYDEVYITTDVVNSSNLAMAFLYDKDFNYIKGVNFGTSSGIQSFQNEKLVIESNVKYITVTSYLTTPKVSVLCSIGDIDTVAKNFVGYKMLNDNNILLLLPCENDKIIVDMKKRGGNNLFEFNQFRKCDADKNISDITNTTGTLIIGNSTDWFAPFQVGATNNADGDSQTVTFTGGNHQYNNAGSGSTPTAYTENLKFYADDKEIDTALGYCHTLKICWNNKIQAWNTKKSDGSGRYVLNEYHTLTISNDGKINVSTDVVALEDVNIKTWYGYQFSEMNTVFTNGVRFIGSANRVLNTSSSANSNSKKCDSIIAYSNNTKLEMELDSTYGDGDRKLYDGNLGGFRSGNKCYFYIVDNGEFAEGSMISIRGSYKLSKNIIS